MIVILNDDDGNDGDDDNDDDDDNGDNDYWLYWRFPLNLLNLGMDVFGGAQDTDEVDTIFSYMLSFSEDKMLQTWYLSKKKVYTTLSKSN